MYQASKHKVSWHRARSRPLIGCCFLIQLGQTSLLQIFNHAISAARPSKTRVSWRRARSRPLIGFNSIRPNLFIQMFNHAISAARPSKTQVSWRRAHSRPLIGCCFLIQLGQTSLYKCLIMPFWPIFLPNENHRLWQNGTFYLLFIYLFICFVYLFIFFCRSNICGSVTNS